MSDIKYTLLINQESIRSMGLIGVIKANHIAVLEVIISMYGSKGVKRKVDGDEVYIWAASKQVSGQLPMFEISPERCRKLIYELCDAGLLKRHPQNENEGRCYVTHGDRYEEYNVVKNAQGGGQKCTGGVVKNDHDPWSKMTSNKTIKDKTTKDKTINNPPFGSDEFLAAWNDFLEHRKEIRKKVTPKAEERMFKDFQEWGEEISKAAINFSIKNGYTGIFRPNDYTIKAMQQQKPTGYEHLKGFNAKLHNNPDFRYKISPSGTAINYERR